MNCFHVEKHKGSSSKWTRVNRCLLVSFVFVAAKIQPTKLEEQMDKFILSPPVRDTVNAPFISSSLPASPPDSPESRQGMTVCAWITLTYFRRPTLVFSLKDEDAGTWEISLAMVPSGLLLRSKGSSVVIPIQILPLTVNHFCIRVSLSTLSLFFNGRSVQNNRFPGGELLGQGLNVYFGGGEQWPDLTPLAVGIPHIKDDAFLFRSIPRGSFAGTIIGPAVWEDELSFQDIASLSLCETIAWPSVEVEWIPEGTNFEILTADIGEQCASDAINYLFLPKALTFEKNQIVCKKLGLELLSPQNGKEYSRLIDGAKPFHNVCGKGKWYAWLQPMNNQPDQERQMINSCEALTISGQESISCQENICSGCQLKDKQMLFILRGICPLSSSDLSFFIHKDVDTLGFYFYGLERYNISHDGSKWWLGDMGLNLYVASVTDAVHPIGVRNWTIETDLCGYRSGDIVSASLSPCQTDEAVCSDGTCIPLSKRCDSFPDCLDASDEFECHSIRSSSILVSRSPPPPPPVEVNLCVDILRVPTVPPLNSFSLLLEFKFSWSDSRVSVANISPGRISAISPQNPKLWRPKISTLSPGRSSPLNVVDVNTDTVGHTFVSPQSEGTTWTALTFSKPLLDTRDTSFRDMLYPGSNTTFTVTELVTQVLDCEFDFSFFPFDEQVCNLPLVMSTWPSSHLILKKPIVGRYIGPMRLLHYTLDKTKTQAQIFKIDGKIYSGLIITLHLARRPALFVLVVYLPSSMLLLINCSTLWMRCHGEGGNGVRISVTCVVLIVFLLQWLILTLCVPAINHLTAIDVWLCFCIILTLLHLAIHVLLDVFKDDNEHDLFSRVPSRITSSRVRDVKPTDARSLYEGLVTKVVQMEAKNMRSVPYWILFISRVVSPILLAFFNGTYWPFVFYFRKNDFI